MFKGLHAFLAALERLVVEPVVYIAATGCFRWVCFTGSKMCLCVGRRKMLDKVASISLGRGRGIFIDRRTGRGFRAFSVHD